jgi:NADPH:quinone reductase-like Zn-dependent oxidoreductase
MKAAYLTQTGPPENIIYGDLARPQPAGTQVLVQTRIDRVLPLAEAARAHRLQEQNTLGRQGTLAGKLVLKPGA